MLIIAIWRDVESIPTWTVLSKNFGSFDENAKEFELAARRVAGLDHDVRPSSDTQLLSNFMFINFSPLETVFEI